jgi:hypothetical protein
MSKAHTSGAQIGGCVGNGRAAAPGAADWLCLAAAPTFAAMALLEQYIRNKRSSSVSDDLGLIDSLLKMKGTGETAARSSTEPQ